MPKDKKHKADTERMIKERGKKAKWRKETSNKINETICYRQPYSTRSSLSKAANKVKIMLPYSPSKQKAVILKLAVKLNCKFVETSIEYRGATSLNKEIKQKVFEFYENDD